jgi:hypothetical protein
MTVTKFLVFAIIAAGLLPAGREMLDELARGLSSTKQQAVLSSTASVAPTMTGSPWNRMDGDAAGAKDFANFATGSR